MARRPSSSNMSLDPHRHDASMPCQVLWNRGATVAQIAALKGISRQQVREELSL